MKMFIFMSKNDYIYQLELNLVAKHNMFFFYIYKCVGGCLIREHISLTRILRDFNIWVFISLPGVEPAPPRLRGRCSNRFATKQDNFI